MEPLYGIIMLPLAITLSCGNIIGPKDITRISGTNNELIRCQSFPVDTTPFWKINGVIYYYSAVPQPFVPSRDGRSIEIPVIELSMNGTSFQCFIPSSSGRSDLINSSIGVLTVVDNEYSQVTRFNNMPHVQPRLEISHNNLFFSHNSLSLAWRTLNSEVCIYYELLVRYDCDVHSQSEVALNKTKDRRITLQRGDLDLLGRRNNAYFNITSYNGQGDLCEDHHLEAFQFSAGIVTEYLQLCMADRFESCSPASICTDIPPLNARQTLILALPFLPVTSGLEEDLLCPVHLLPGERCVDLLSCNHFRGSVYANCITICRRINNIASQEVCFHNVSDIMNGTRLHFFYSDLHCRPDGIQHESSRTYVKSVQLLVANPAGNKATDMTITSSAPLTSLPLQRAETTTVVLFSVGLILTFICGLSLGAGGSCVVYCCFRKSARSSHKSEEMNIAVTSNPAYEVVHLTR